jgi:hypothetical protein
VAASNFDSGMEGWQVVDVNFAESVNPPSVSAAYLGAWHLGGGNPDGYLEQPSDPNPLWQWFSAPAWYLGDMSAAYGGAISFDLRDSADGQAAEVLPAVVLVGGGKSLFHDATWPVDDWTHYQIPLTASGWYLDMNPAQAASEADLSAALGDLEALYLNADWSTIQNSVGLDNVRVTAVPEPSGLLLVAFGIATALRR